MVASCSRRNSVKRPGIAGLRSPIGSIGSTVSRPIPAGSSPIGSISYPLRHFAITTWLRAGIPVHVVQRMAGHTNLSTTQRYVHFLKEDLEEAARRLPVRRRGGNGDGEKN
ncbi:tyrosine-type recombinase/integrase [Polyangium spumosum]|uniref:tyrosine-type recombinase/integrase n=1 Tax=Polyangium spumosum TaxID=889282 RepID=UPI00147824C6